VLPATFRRPASTHISKIVMSDQYKFGPVVIASYLLMAAALLLVMGTGLLAALFAGLLVYSLVHLLTPALGKKISGHRARMIAVALLGALIVAILTAAIWGVISFLQSDAGNVQVLLQRMADIIEASREQIPPWLRDNLPQNAEAIRQLITVWLREHAAQAKLIGQQAGRTVVHLLIGMVIGAMAALYNTNSVARYRPLAAALHARVINLEHAFRRIVFAQVRIAGINAILTGIYLLVILPLAGVHLPLTKSMIAITFFAGLLPVIGNLISNTVLVVVGLSHSLYIAVASLAFLMLIHKLEYFLNAKIIGSHINAHVWELLTAMLVMEALFGVPGVIAAPVLYAYVKRELSERGLV
jgi:predicted PurR-regulated permease PerM